ncbi:pyridoxal-phosphate dependent enzyme [Pseudobdellovibrio exovorus]|uniref:Tryptophan synthase beta chain-like PALP domain-containing protein n=1 Tax=Pseudobdellovibrio exovorus JSS TaxID=1184267 RepID=M4V5E5_9BACT|nr:pyridoxal-phosphate dependent enzyme [Pseudobdellovibrio exovorus]AGH94552.1 hypothetical protein A11Q_332 [Pseudobdellovibrio exovorus JSS]
MIRTLLVRIQDERLSESLKSRQLWTTLEGENPSGSIKDRMVLPELLQALKSGSLRVGDCVSEISAGSTALSLAHYCQHLNLKCHLFVPNSIAEPLKEKLTSLKATLTLCDPQTAYQEYEDFLKANKLFAFQQMQRASLRSHYKTWAQEHLLHKIQPTLDAVIGAVGTGHSLLGISEALQPHEGAISAEPISSEKTDGVRNIKETRFGANDPCPLNFINKRYEISQTDFFPHHQIMTNVGLITISDSFRMTLAAAQKFSEEVPSAKRLFLVNSHGRRTEGGFS